MKNRVLLFLLLVIIYSSVISCKSDEESIKSEWKYMDGYHFGDWVDFTAKSWRLKNDTIYNGKIPFAILEDYESAFPGAENKMTLKTIDGKSKGFYTDK